MSSLRPQRSRGRCSRQRHFLTQRLCFAHLAHAELHSLQCLNLALNFSPSALLDQLANNPNDDGRDKNERYKIAKNDYCGRKRTAHASDPNDAVSALASPITRAVFASRCGVPHRENRLSQGKSHYDSDCDDDENAYHCSRGDPATVLPKISRCSLFLHFFIFSLD